MEAGSLSPDMFDDSPSQTNAIEQSWIGTPLTDIYQQNWAFHWDPPPIKPSSDHIVMFKLPITPGEIPKPCKTNESYCWDKEHVRMPFSPKNLYPAEDLLESSSSMHEPKFCLDPNSEFSSSTSLTDRGETILKSRWCLIQEALSKPINSSQDLETCISTYNNKLGRAPLLHEYFNTLDEDENNYFFVNIMPKIAKLALQLPELLPSSLPLLKRGTNKTISLTQMQIASLLANAFLCTFPRRNTMKSTAEYSTYPDINFNRFFQAYYRDDETSCEKMKCLINYFRRVVNFPPTGVVTFQRIFLRGCELPEWSTCNLPLSSMQLHIDDTGTIDDNGLGLLQVDFANKYIGGGVLGLGCVQEEIRFMVCPELLVTRLFTEVLGPTEALLITGVEQYNKSKGYANTFEWVSNHEDKTPRDSFNRIKCYLVAIDALYFAQPSEQYKIRQILRELNKAYAGYYAPKSWGAIPAVATGNWGCGAFRGNKYLKSLLQLMACRAASRDMVYYTFGDKELKEKFYDLFMTIVQHDGTIGTVYQYLTEFSESGLSGKQFYPWIMKKIVPPQPPTPTSIPEPKRRKKSEASQPKTSQPIDMEGSTIEDFNFSDNDSDFAEVISEKKAEPGKSILLDKLEKMEGKGKNEEEMEVDESPGKSVEIVAEKRNGPSSSKKKISDYFKIT